MDNLIGILASKFGTYKTDTETQATVLYDEYQIHEGNHYFYKTWVDIEGADTVVYFMFVTPTNGGKIHARAELYGEAEFNAEIYEGATTSNDGTPITTFNNDRNSSNTPELSAYASPTVTNDGTQIWSGKLGSGRTPSTISPGFGYGILAKSNTKYLFKITKIAAGTHYVDVNFWWHEE